jgi:putative FmdB family regulatory protein
MPLYDIRCSKSGKIFERFIKLEKFSEPIECACGAPANRVISSPLFSVDKTGYNCPVTGRWIGSKREHQENLKRTGCRVLEDGETKAAAEIRRKREEAFDKKIEDTVEKEFESYSSDKKEQLHNELVNGKLDLVVERS